MLPWYPPPPPQIHDEFSYLLQGDTFAHGRIANPTPPFWQHFESEYVLMNPAYASQYQPAQGIVLAVGEVLFRHPWFGVWLSVGLMCALFAWALGYVLPPAWALFGAFVAALQFGIFGFWMNSYFGGAAAAGAGAIVVGSLARMRAARKGAHRPRRFAPSGSSCCLPHGLFEAVLWSLCGVGVDDCSDVAAVGSAPPPVAVCIPFAAGFLAGSAALAWYNWEVTGNPAESSLPCLSAYLRDSAAVLVATADPGETLRFSGPSG